MCSILLLIFRLGPLKNELKKRKCMATRSRAVRVRPTHTARPEEVKLYFLWSLVFKHHLLAKTKMWKLDNKRSGRWYLCWCHLPSDFYSPMLTDVDVSKLTFQLATSYSETFYLDVYWFMLCGWMNLTLHYFAWIIVPWAD